jgi:hypothetical protein
MKATPGKRTVRLRGGPESPSDARRMRVRLFGGQRASESDRLERTMRAAGHAVEEGPVTAETLRALASDPPNAVVIDLSHQPSHGREVAVWLRVHARTRRVPIVFVGGEPDKVAVIRALLPDATYASAGRVASAVRRAIARPPAAPVTPSSVFAGYSGTPLPKKLGVKPGATVALVGAPAGFDLGTLPERTVVRRGIGRRSDLVLWFTSSRAQLEREMGRMALLADRDGLWIIWPKQASGVKTDLTQAVVRAAGLSAGLVDYKVCAVDATWSGLKFAPRRRKS